MATQVERNIQDPFFNVLRREKIPVTIFLVNGVKLTGVITSFDRYCVYLKSNVTQVVFKHAISTVMPSREIPNPLLPENGGGG